MGVDSAGWWAGIWTGLDLRPAHYRGYSRPGPVEDIRPMDPLC